MQRENMPCVLLPRRVSHSDVSYIAADHSSGGRTLTEHLIGLGHRRIAFIGLPEVHETDTDRRAGYFQALEAADIDRDPSLMIDIRLSDKNAVQNAMQHLLNLDEPPTAIELFTDRMAMRALATTRLWGIRVPEELSIAGFDGILASGISTPGITTVRQPIEQMGKLAAESLLGLMANSDHPPAQHVLPVSLIVRGSTGPAPGEQRS
jgi:LacI family transcriptional regulator